MKCCHIGVLQSAILSSVLSLSTHIRLLALICYVIVLAFVFGFYNDFGYQEKHFDLVVVLYCMDLFFWCNILFQLARLIYRRHVSTEELLHFGDQLRGYSIEKDGQISRKNMNFKLKQTKTM